MFVVFFWSSFTFKSSFISLNFFSSERKTFRLLSELMTLGSVGILRCGSETMLFLLLAVWGASSRLTFYEESLFCCLSFWPIFSLEVLPTVFLCIGGNLKITIEG